MKTKTCLVVAALALGTFVGLWAKEPPRKPARPVTKAAVAQASEAQDAPKAVPAVALIPATPATATVPAATATPAGRFAGALLRALSNAAGVDTPTDTAATLTIEAHVDPTPLAADATHQQFKLVKVAGDKGATLQTLTLTDDGRVVCLVGPARYAPVGVGGTDTPPSEVRLFDRDGKELQRWSVPFAGQSVAVSPKGEIFVAGDGKVARYSAEGKLDVQVEVPHIVDMLKNNEALEKQAREQLQSTRDSYELQIKQLKQQLEAAKKNAPAESDAPKTNPRVIVANDARFIEQQLKAYENALQTFGNQKVEDIVKQNMSRVRIINGLSVTDKEVYLMCGESQGYGYSLWRMDLALSKSDKVLSRLSGCCGQMDVQVRGDTIAVAENTRHRVARFDRDGALVDSFGIRGRESNGETFGGCCNPMNCRITAEGDVYTAESEGIIKKFNAKGEFLALIGVVKLTGGCKNVAVAVSAKGERIYFCDLPGSQFIILEPKPDVEAAAAAGG